MHLPHPDDTPSLVYANHKGEIKNYPGLKMAGRNGDWFSKPELEDLIPLPQGSELFLLPDRMPVGFSLSTDDSFVLEYDPDKPNETVQAVAAFMAPAHTAIHTAAYEPQQDDLNPLPLFAYTAVGWHKENFWVAGFRSDPGNRQDADQFDLEKISNRTTKKLKANQRNRLIQHLGKCCLTYGCPAARNYFLGRWEAPLPTSPICNAQCVGCISLQSSGCCPATQDRIGFVPSVREISDLAIPHLKHAPKPVVSFGQGCEGEPLLQAKTIEKSIRTIRLQTERGTINMNSNASLPDKIDMLAEAGLDSLRVSMNSARKLFHQRYYNPNGFTFQDVLDSINTMKLKNKFVSLNYFILPGFTDDPEEFAAFCNLIDSYGPDLIQLRNLNMDPDWYFKVINHQPDKPPIGIRNWLSKTKELFPNLQFGYFNPALR
jgi:pyruvate-formate lyase-activating enzyme